MCLTEAASFASLRHLFATMLLFGPPADPGALWKKHSTSLADDFYLEAARRPEQCSSALREKIEVQALRHIQEILIANGKSLEDFPGLPTLPLDLGATDVDGILAHELSYDRASQEAILTERVGKLNPEQHAAWTTIKDAIDSLRNEVFFISGGAGSGKTYLYGLILAYVRSKAEVALAVASSGIAAQLLPGGRTAHSLLRIPLELHDSSMCAISRQSTTASLLRSARLLLWDEAVMTHRRAFEAVDRTLRFIRDNPTPFGGGVVVLGGDWRQALPVIPRASRAEIIDATLKNSYLWSSIKVLHLSRNERVGSGSPAAARATEDWVRWLEQVGQGTLPTTDGLITLPEANVVPGVSVDRLIDTVFPDFQSHISDPNSAAQWVADRAILAMRNTDVDRLNNAVLERLPGDTLCSYSADSIADPDDASNYPIEFLNQLSFSGLPNHQLVLKPGVPVILLRNIDVVHSLCNGTRLIVRRMTLRVLEAEIATGKDRGTIVLLPRISLTLSDPSCPIPLRRTQFPVRPAFAMTVNQAQGQTLKGLVGRYLNTTPFSSMSPPVGPTDLTASVFCCRTGQTPPCPPAPRTSSGRRSSIDSTLLFSPV